ncbi:MAG: hypothetical protein KGY61_03580 [Desulfobacterales bacterium]|nr:hypothetical protein [Desulfobacterales bacterium]
MANAFSLRTFWVHFATALLAALLLFTGMAQTVFAADKRIAVIGSSRIYDNVTSARNAAIAEGLLSAVESAALEMIPRQHLKSDFETISAELYDHRRDFTQSYQVLKEVDTGTYYRVLIRTTVSTDKIQSLLKDLGITMAAEALPKTLFLIAEKHAGDLSRHYWWHSERSALAQNAAIKPIKQVFWKKGFPVIDHRRLPQNEILSELELSADLTAAEAVTLGQRAEADVVVFGNATATETRNKRGENIKTFRGSISLTAVATQTESIIATAEQTETSASRRIRDGSRQALSNAGYRIGNVLAEKISTAWQQQAQSGGRLEIEVKGEGDILPELVRFRKTLRHIQGVTALQTEERRQNKAILSIKYEGSPRGLADKILLTQFEGFGVNIYETTESRIGIELLSDPSITESEID